MRVRVLFFGRLKDIVGKSEENAELSDGARVEDLFARYGRSFPELAFLPPVSGGAISAGATVEENLCALVREPIETAEIAAKLKAPPDGAVVVFEGIVRNHSGNRATLYLDYEAYEAMAIAKMREIGAQMREKFSIRRS